MTQTYQFCIFFISHYSASDKCDRESECLTFSQHMTVAGEMWQRHLNRSIHLKDSEYHMHQVQPTIVFTTEATSMVDEQKAFVTEKQVVTRYPDFTFNFVTNHHDVTPNSGFMKDSRRKWRKQMLVLCNE